MDSFVLRAFAVLNVFHFLSFKFTIPDKFCEKKKKQLLFHSILKDLIVSYQRTVSEQQAWFLIFMGD